MKIYCHCEERKRRGNLNGGIDRRAVLAMTPMNSLGHELLERLSDFSLIDRLLAVTSSQWLLTDIGQI